MIKECLSEFVNGNLFEACLSLLEGLHINIRQETTEPINFADYYDNPIPKYLQEVLKKIREIYYIGVVTDLPQTGRPNSLNIATEQLQDKYSGMFFFAADITEGYILKRSEIASLTRGFNRISRANPVVLFIRQAGKLAISTCERTEFRQQWRNGEKLGRVSMLRDIRCVKPHRGHLDILEALGDKPYPTFDELYHHWMDVFSSEVLTEKFYSELSDWYAWATQIVRFPNDVAKTDIDHNMNEMAVIRLITRMIFVWFLYCKRLIPKELFDKTYIRNRLLKNFAPEGNEPLLYDAEKSLYYRTILQNLFFATLNCPIVAEGKEGPNNRRFCNKAFHGMRSDQGIDNIMRYKNDFMPGGAEEFLNLANSTVPFLNGGLFDCLDEKSEGKYYDGFSENKTSLLRLHVPDYLFFGGIDDVDLSKWYKNNNKRHVKVHGLIDLFKRYYFTVEENTPLDQDVSLDPELLGKAFENLLAAYVPATGANARKMTGSFYTPREIVQYMVDESLTAHLKRMCGDEHEDTYRTLLSYSDEEVALSDDECNSIMNAIYHCRILDPACGSGAFPMGILQQMVHVLKRIDPTNEKWKNYIFERILKETRKAFSEDDDAERQSRLRDLEDTFDYCINDPDYSRKLYLIEHCIYGVDIQPIAIQISKLRFFISLIVDQHPTTDAEKNFDIRPLPNLEAKFVAANTLIPIDYDSTLVDGLPEVMQYKEELKRLNHKMFLVRSKRTKDKLKEEIENTRKSLTEVIDESGFVTPGVADKLASWDMFNQNKYSKFFDPEWMFGVKDGFDIVIGNPPYVQIKKLDIKDQYKNVQYLTFATSGDLYCLFYEFATNILSSDDNRNNTGTAVFITSNKWLRSNYGKILRDYFLNRANPYKLIDLGPGVFANAAVDTNILVWNKIKYQKHTYFSSVTKYFTPSSLIFNILDLSLYTLWTSESSKYSDIKSKIEKIKSYLINFGVELDYGILTGANNVFILSHETAKKLIAIDKKNSEIIKPLLRGKDIGRYCATFKNLYLLCAHNGVKRLNIPPINIERDYPSLIPYYNSFGESFKSRKEQGDSYYNLRSCSYIMKFEQPKIIYADIVQDKGKFYYDEDAFYTNDTAFLISGGNFLRYLVGILNSTLFNFAYKHFYCGGSLGKNGLRFKRDFLLRVPIPMAKGVIKSEIENLVMFAISKRRNDSSADISSIEFRIDFLVYHLYGLTYDEVLEVDPQTPIIREEYNDYNPQKYE